MKTIIGNQIRVKDPSEDLKEWCKKNLILANPEYAKKQRMGFWTGDTPKVIRLFSVDGTDLILPFGTLREIRKHVLQGDIDVDFPEPQEVDFGGEVPLYDYQEEAVENMIHFRYGILQSAAGSGKTQMGLAIAQRIGHRTLWLTHTKDLLDQSMKRACQYFYAGDMGTITEGEVNIGQTITFATIQTMSRCDLFLMRDVWDTIIVDECHRVAGTPDAVTMFSHVLNNLRARHKYGLSATVHRADGMIRATTALLGQVVYQVPDAAVADKIMKVEIHPRGTGTPLSYDCKNPDGTINYAKTITYLTKAPVRFRMILDDLRDSANHYNLILAERVGYLNIMRAILESYLDGETVLIHGQTPKKEREQGLQDLRDGKKHFLFATYQLAKEGLDIPRLDRLFLVTPQKDYAVVVQSVGRVARQFPGKDQPVVYDYVDNDPFFIHSYKRRLSHYRKIGCEIVEEP